jgi:NitT/TauT family transport system substrate-binding protein
MLIVRKDLWDSGAVKSAADLKGKTIAAAGGPGSGGEYLVAKCLEPAGLTIFDVNLQNIANPDMAAAMQAKSVDAVLTGSPYATAIVNAGTGVPLVKDMTPGSMTIVFVYSGKFMKERPEAAKRFMLAMMKGARSMQGEGYLSATNIASYMKYMNTTEENIRNTPPSLYDPDMTVRVEDMADIQNTHMKNGRLNYTTPLPLNNIVDESWQQYALMILGPYGK